MEIITKSFAELTNVELYKLLQLRSTVFVVEQDCVYLDQDGIDLDAVHVFVMDGENMVACLRVIDKGNRLDEVSIGRVVTAPSHRKTGLGAVIMKKGIEVAKSHFNAKLIKIGAQKQAQGFYEKLGFKAIKGSDYLEDNQPHIYMTYEYDN